MLLLIFPILVLAQENPEPQDGVRSFHFLAILFSWRGHNFYSFFDRLWLSSLWLSLKKYKFEIKTDEKTNKYISCSLFSPLLDLELSNRASKSCPGGTPTVAATTLGRLLSTPSAPSSSSSSSYDTIIQDFMIFPQRWTSPNNPTARELLLAPLTTTLGIGEEALGGLSSTISCFFIVLNEYICFSFCFVWSFHSREGRGVNTFANGDTYVGEVHCGIGCWLLRGGVRSLR